LAHHESRDQGSTALLNAFLERAQMPKTSAHFTSLIAQTSTALCQQVAQKNSASKNAKAKRTCTIL